MNKFLQIIIAPAVLVGGTAIGAMAQNGKWLIAAAHYSPAIDLEKIKAGKSQTEAMKN